MESKIKHTCGNCENFVMYYTYRKANFHKTMQGFCVRAGRIVKSRNCCAAQEGCELWREKETREELDCVKGTLRSIARSLRAIATYLKEE